MCGSGFKLNKYILHSPLITPSFSLSINPHHLFSLSLSLQIFIFSNAENLGLQNMPKSHEESLPLCIMGCSRSGVMQGQGHAGAGSHRCGVTQGEGSHKTYPPHFSPRAMRADLSRSRPREASSCSAHRPL